MKKSRGWQKKFKHWLEGTILTLVIRTAIPLPPSALRGLGNWLGDLSYLIWRSRRRITINNLQLAFGEEKDGREIRSMARSVHRHLFRGVLESIRLILLPDERLNGILEVVGRESLDRALDEGRGVVAISAHLGYFPLIGRKLASDGYPISYVIHFPEVRMVPDYIRELGRKVKVNFISSLPRKLCVNECLKRLRRNEIICLLADQHTSHGVFVDFFGQPASTATGPVILAQRTGAKVLPIFAICQSDKTHQIRIDPPLPLKLSKDREKDAFINTAMFTGVIESYIRKYPTQWAWIHRRWRSKPKEDR